MRILALDDCDLRRRVNRLLDTSHPNVKETCDQVTRHTSHPNVKETCEQITRHM